MGDRHIEATIWIGDSAHVRIGFSEGDGFLDLFERMSDREKRVYVKRRILLDDVELVSN
jgi:hypothetical protein